MKESRPALCEKCLEMFFVMIWFDFDLYINKNVIDLYTVILYYYCCSIIIIICAISYNYSIVSLLYTVQLLFKCVIE